LADDNTHPQIDLNVGDVVAGQTFYWFFTLEKKPEAVSAF